MKSRCEWASNIKLLADYHDAEWGVPVHDDRKLFEMLTLEGAQAGLNWLTILKKRQGYLKAFKNFDLQKVRKLKKTDVTRLMKDEGIVRNRLKIESVISNAEAILEVQKEFGSFDSYIWSFVKGKTIATRRNQLNRIPATTPESDEMSKALKKRGFRFVGSTICYAFMQACGLVDDHTDQCYKSAKKKKK